MRVNDQWVDHGRLRPSQAPVRQPAVGVRRSWSRRILGSRPLRAGLGVLLVATGAAGLALWAGGHFNARSGTRTGQRTVAVEGPPATSAPPSPVDVPVAGLQAAPSPSASVRRARSKTSGPIGGGPVTGGKPDTGNTGVPAGTVLKKYSGQLKVTTNGAVIDATDVSEGIDIQADNVTIKRTRVRCSSGASGGCIVVHTGSTGTVIEDTDVGGGASGTSPTGVDVGITVQENNSAPASTTRISRVDIRNTADGLRSDGSLTVTDSYIHDLDPANGAHGDGSQSTGWSNMVFRHNTIVGGLNSGIYLNQEDPNPSIGSVVIDDNWLEGSPSVDTSFPLYVNSGSSNVTVTNNKFNHRGYAPAMDRGGKAIVQWSGNTFEDTGALIAAPAHG